MYNPGVVPDKFSAHDPKPALRFLHGHVFPRPVCMAVVDPVHELLLQRSYLTQKGHCQSHSSNFEDGFLCEILLDAFGAQLLAPAAIQTSSCTLLTFVNIRCRLFFPICLFHCPVAHQRTIRETGCFKFASTNSNTKCKRPGLHATSSLSFAKVLIFCKLVID